MSYYTTKQTTKCKLGKTEMGGGNVEKVVGVKVTEILRWMNGSWKARMK